jgi:sensor c-di-GMP phosphodiesterase-like protein
MKGPKRLAVAVIAAVCVTVAVPVVGAFVVSRVQADEQERHYVTRLAREALLRAEQTGEQLSRGRAMLQALDSSDPCSPEALRVMRRIDLGSTLLQAVGRLDGNRMVCSSVLDRNAFVLGPEESETTVGSRIWTHVKPAGTDTPYVAVGLGSFVGIIHRELALSFVDLAPGSVVAVFNWKDGRPLIQRGQVDPRWIRRDGGNSSFFRANGYSVSVLHSANYEIGAVAAVPVATTASYTLRAAIVLVPLGILTGLLLASLLLRVLRERRSMASMIRKAIRKGEFHVVYQPIVDLATGLTIGAESLVRWQRPGGEQIAPDTFIAVAEKEGVIQAVTAHVLDLLAEDVRHMTAIVPNFRIGVNFSAADIHNSGIVRQVERFVARSGISHDNLVIEATERSLVDVERAEAALQAFRRAGAKVAIDDFGTGYSSLGFLAQLEIDCLKIDRLFVQALGTDSATSFVAERIIEMARDLNLTIVAEGVETPDQAKRLRGLDVELAQGYLFGIPMRLEDIMQRLRAERQIEPIRLVRLANAA